MIRKHFPSFLHLSIAVEDNCKVCFSYSYSTLYLQLLSLALLSEHHHGSTAGLALKTLPKQEEASPHHITLLAWYVSSCLLACGRFSSTTEGGKSD